MNKRQLSAYEFNHLVKHKIDPYSIESYGAKPVEYITGKADFRGREFSVSTATLIPRIETEDLVGRVLAEIEKDNTSKQKTIVDVGTGSGCIGISMGLDLLDKGYEVEVVLVDTSETALAVAKKNIKNLVPYNYRADFRLVLSDLLVNCPRLEDGYWLVANLPYIPHAFMANLDVSVKNFEPIDALDGGKDGMKYIRELLDQIDHLESLPIQIWLEIDESMELELFPRPRGYNLALYQDSLGKNRFVQYVRGKEEKV